jgi:hypothetical protein
MSTPEENAHEIAGDLHGDKGPSRSRSGGTGIVVLSFFIGFAASLVVGWLVFPKLLYSEKTQPIDFNHVLHVDLVDDGCRSCHFFREDGTFNGIPRLAQCIECHDEVQGDDPEEEKFVRQYVQKEREVPWLAYSRQPDCVFFSHSAHVLMGKMDCVTCHGHIGESTHTRSYQENRITGYSRDIWGRNILGFKKNSWDRMKMDDCAECHKRNDVKQTSAQTVQDACFVCHK